ncbi:uncharacterized protein HMPREF1541_00345 [Cyphellophora europaea CBS 101466]|uniref:Uncharacterized protein n=1 Tax=Cyphellophora europaea (strain CBS 101466) TaxID=1220924 RepID=W2SBQ0_CYPE1|nr:uncharacterized protein HMPREF1541_00345 [Cyphellophora europaea CBS 101466]ETN46161.1 hypothetical protein HMPREF1541_00345 [Cyphellophora europaea CBS 101466]
MGPPPPPETPSRVMHPSPNMFPSLQFSPDIFSNSPFGPVTAPIYPQQRLFWDSNMGMDDPNGLPPYTDPFAISQADFSASFNSSSTIVPSYLPSSTSQQQSYDLPPTTTSVPSNYIDGSTFAVPFTTSPLAPRPRDDNPSMFLSSPARRFANDQRPVYPVAKSIREVPAYHHQIEESRREQEAKRAKKGDPKQPSITRSVMEALRRPVSPVKKDRPGLRRSVTHSGVGSRGPHNRQQSHVSFLSSLTNAPESMSRSRSGRLSPLKSMFDARQASKRTSLSLAIDENGVARTVVAQVPEEEAMDLDESDSLSSISSRDETDFHELRSQPNSFAFGDDGDQARGLGHSKSSSLASHSSAWQSSRTSSTTSRANRQRKPVGILDPMSESELHSTSGDAQQALRAIIEDRSRTGSGNDASLANGPSAQFNSSPPVPHAQFANFNASPTTITDPDMATPSTDRGSQASHGSTRCVCGLSPDDVPGTMMQW